MSKTNIGLVDFCKAALADGCGYVYGATGQICTESFLDQQAKRYPADNLAGGQMRKTGEKWLGKRVADCSGIVKYYLWADEYGKNIKVYDLNQDVGMSYSKAKVKGPLETLPETPGTLLYMPGHVGVYIGDGEVIEARGTAYGVVKTKLKERPWTAWWECPFIEYVKEEKKPEPSKPKTYTVKAGDTPWGLAVKFLGDGNRYKELMDLNGIKSPYTIYAGQVLKLPGEAVKEPEPVRTYTVKAGDTPWGIADRKSVV